MKTIQIGNHEVGANQPTLIIAEIGVNHDGSTQRALELVQIAADCGADAVKLQIFRADQLMHAAAEFAEYQETRVNDADPRAMLRRYELSEPALRQIAACAQSLGMVALATPFSLADVDLIERLGLPAIKIASPDCVNQLLLGRALRTRLPLLISTGAATIDEVSQCIRWAGDNPILLLHCVSSYPVQLGDVHLAWISQLAEQFDLPVGYSDHASDERCGALARAAGACVIEKHLTYDRAASGPDHAASADPAMFRRYVRSIRDAELAMGVGEKRVLSIESDVRRVSRQSLVTTVALAKGTRLTIDLLSTQRPGTGISAANAERVVGRSASRDLPAGTLLQWDMLESTEQNLDAQAA